MKETFLNYKLGNMMLKEKIGQMIMIDYRNITEMNMELERILTKYNPGGFILFRSNILNFCRTRKLINDIKNITNIKSLIAVDQEGGRVQRLDRRVGFNKYPAARIIGDTMNTEVAMDVGKKMGYELRMLGVDMNMAPVLDIFSNPKNQVIGDRAYGSNSESVKKMALAYAEGLKSEKIMAIGKHFPGHGDTLKDSHIDLPIVEKDLDKLSKLELLPFIEAVKQEISGIMVGHIAVPNVTGNLMPASLSKMMVSSLLRKKIGFNGLIMPDSLKMKALERNFSNEEIYFRCVEAGNDMLLMPENITMAYETINKCVNEGIYTEDRINESVYRILSKKFDCGFFDEEYNKFLSYKRVKEINK